MPDAILDETFTRPWKNKLGLGLTWLSVGIVAFLAPPPIELCAQDAGAVVQVVATATLSASAMPAAQDAGDASQEAADGDTPLTVPTDRKGRWSSILPPLVAILIALALRRVIPALFVGILLGAWLVRGLSIGGLWQGLLDTYQVWVLNAVIDADHAAILLFTLMIGGMVGIVSKSGGMQGVVNRIAKWATSPQRGQIATAALGLAVFFDDYANTLVVGNTMRPVTDRLRVSREKLAYIVDSTAAPVACLAFVTTWIGYEVGLIGEAMEGLAGFEGSPYSMFLSSIGYSFYPILALVMVFAISITGRDFGPMYAAEKRARTTGAVIGAGAKVDEAATQSDQTTPNPDKPQRAINAILPVAVLVFGVIFFLFQTGEGSSLREIIGSADSYRALVYASLLGMLTAAVLAVGQRILTVDEMVESWYTGLKSMLFAMIILVLAWSLSEITKALGTADFLVTLLGGSLSPWMLPAIVFILSAATAFATGSSWGTMGILMPLVLPLGWAMLQLAGDPTDHMHLMSSSIACVLAGAVWGDHCSPISDTTILSSMASGCDHIDHVRTQLPYAGIVGVLALLLGTIPVGLGLPWWVGMAIGIVGVLALVRFVGKRVDDGISITTAS
jgi:Na+/H+ antiporter NhaC